VNHRIARIAAVATLVSGAVLAPAAAHASAIYPPSNACSANPSTITAGSTVDFSCDAATFAPDEAVTITVTGENGANTSFAFVRFAVTTGSTVRTSTSTGALDPVTITLPSDARGVYNIEAISATSAGGTASASISAEGSGLPTTGGDSTALIGLLIGGGALVAAGAAVAITSVVRRRRDG